MRQGIRRPKIRNGQILGPRLSEIDQKQHCRFAKLTGLSQQVGRGRLRQLRRPRDALQVGQEIHLLSGKLCIFAPGSIDDPTDQPEDIAAVAAAGEAALLRKLRTRSLSVREARAVLAQHGVDDDAGETIVERFVGHGYLDDVKLAEQLVHTGVERKGQGRGVIAQTLSKRGIPREVVDAALEELPGDEFDRALEFARSKARSMRGLDRDTALRRLAGQLARRGYGGVAMSAARQALDEASRPASRGVRFE